MDSCGVTFGVLSDQLLAKAWSTPSGLWFESSPKEKSVPHVHKANDAVIDIKALFTSYSLIPLLFYPSALQSPPLTRDPPPITPFGEVLLFIDPVSIHLFLTVIRPRIIILQDFAITILPPNKSQPPH